MKQDIQYQKNMLDLMQSLEKSTFNLDDLKDFWSDKNEENQRKKQEKFVFHLELLHDQELIENTVNIDSIGIKRTSSGFIFSINPLRLTLSGHDYISVLNKPGIIMQLSTTFKELGPSETVKLVFKLGAKALDKTLNTLTED